MTSIFTENEAQEFLEKQYQYYTAGEKQPLSAFRVGDTIRNVQRQAFGSITIRQGVIHHITDKYAMSKHGVILGYDDDTTLYAGHVGSNPAEVWKDIEPLDFMIGQILRGTYNTRDHVQNITIGHTRAYTPSAGNRTRYSNDGTTFEQYVQE